MTVKKFEEIDEKYVQWKKQDDSEEEKNGFIFLKVVKQRLRYFEFMTSKHLVLLSSQKNILVLRPGDNICYSLSKYKDYFFERNKGIIQFSMKVEITPNFEKQLSKSKHFPELPDNSKTVMSI